MGFEKSPPGTAPSADPADPVWLQYRDQFPVTKHVTYLNHAAVSPIPRVCAEAMQGLAGDALEFGSLHYDKWLEAYEGLRIAAARLIHADRREIALVKNTSEGISTIAQGIDWRPGDKIVAFREEFPSNYFPWARLGSERCYLEWLSVDDPLERIDRACNGARLLAISYVQYLSGFRANLNAIGEICKRRSVFFFVDAIQGMGAFPLDVQAARIDALAADGHKWMLGPEGCGILYVRKERQQGINPTEIGWMNVANRNDYGSRDMTLRDDAGRYECGTLNTIGSYGLRASLEFLQEVGIDRIAPAVQGLCDRLAEGALRKEYQILGTRSPASSAGILSIQKPGTDTGKIVRELRERKILAIARQGWVRFSPHFYISPDDIDQVIDALP